MSQISNEVVWLIKRDWGGSQSRLYDVRHAAEQCLGLKTKEEQEAYVDELIANGVTVTLKTSSVTHSRQTTYTITPPRTDMLHPVVDYAVENGFALRDTDVREGHLNLFSVKRGVQIQTTRGGIIFKKRQGRKYKTARTYRVNGPAPQYIMDPEHPERLSKEIAADIEEMKGDAIKRDDLFQNMVAQEVRELLPEAHVKCGLNRARNPKEQCQLQYRGSFQCILDPEVVFKRIDGQHSGTFTMRFDADGEVIVTSQLQYTRKWELSPEHPAYTPENIAAWIIRCAEADLRLAVLHMQLQKESERISEDLKIFVKE